MKPGDRYYPKDVRSKMSYVVEEMGELAAAIGKAQRWGLRSSNPELPFERETNEEWILREMKDVRTALDILEERLRKGR